MKKSRLMNTVCACILAISFAVPISAANMAIDSMNITGGSVVWNIPDGPPEEDVFSIFGPDTNLVGGYIGNGGSIAPPFGPSDPDNILFFTFFDGLNDVVTYTAASNLGTAYELAGVVPGGPVPTGTLDDNLNTIEMDLSSWFGNINNATDVWAGTGLDDGFTSPHATGSWNPVTHEYVLTWNSRVPDPTPFPGLESTWTLTGLAHPVITVVPIVIDIKPGSDTNSINVGSAGVIPVAILSAADFDALTVDPTTVSLAGASVKLVGKSDKYLCHQEDVNRDGLTDLVCQVYTAQFMVEEGETSVNLEAETFDGTKLRGEDNIRVVPDN